MEPQFSRLQRNVTGLKGHEEEHLEIEQRLPTQQELELLAKDGTTELERITTQLTEQARLFFANEAIFVRRSDGRISYWSEGAERLYGWTKQEALGKTLDDLLRTEFPVPVSEIFNSNGWEGELRQNKRDGTKIIVASRWTKLRDEQQNPVGWLEINTDITVRKSAEESARRLRRRILALQDAERRKIARELHDCLGQYLASLKINLDLLSRDAPDRQPSRSKAECLAECLEVVERCLTETRTLTHLMHPPLLDEVGFASAAGWYVDGFAQRSGIQVHFYLPPDLPRLRSNLELALFRVLQEGLTNVHRHSRCSAVEITVGFDAEKITLKVKDNGRGIPKGRLERFRAIGAEMGIGLGGMQERVRDLGGHLELHSDGAGTTLTAMVPVSLAASDADGDDDVPSRAGSAA